MLPFRVVVIHPQRGRTTLVVNLDGAPQVGEEVELPHGQTVIVRHVQAADHDDISGVVIAGPA